MVVWQGVRAGAKILEPDYSAVGAKILEWRSGPASPEHDNEKQQKTPKVDSRGEWPGTKTQGQVKKFQAAIYQKSHSKALQRTFFRKVPPQEVKNLRALRPSRINDLKRFEAYILFRESRLITK